MALKFDFDAVGKVTMESRVRHLATEELAALADFYGSPVGKSAMKKITVCMGEMSPHVELELQKAFLKTSQAIGAKPGLNLPLPAPGSEKPNKK